MTNDSIWSAFETDNDAIETGVWFDIVTPEGKNIGQILCLPADGDLNPAYKQYAAAKLQELRRKGGKQALSDFEVTVEMFARTIIKDWRGPGWTDREGNPLPFSVENAITVMTALKPLFTGIAKECMNWANYRKQDADLIAGK